MTSAQWGLWNIGGRTSDDNCVVEDCGMLYPNELRAITGVTT